MRIVEPRYKLKSTQPSKKRSKLPLVAGLLVIIVSVSVGLWWFQFRPSGPVLGSQTTVDKQVEEKSTGLAEEEKTVAPEAAKDQTKDVEPTLIIFSDNELKEFYDNKLLPNLKRVENAPTITGNDTADVRIRQIAESRGYRLRSSPSVDLVSVDGQRLQAPAADDWVALRDAAARAGFSISMVSGYRSENDQRGLFTQRLTAAGATVETVASGDADDLVNEVLITTSIPGYSKHHTGYTIDMQCAGYAFESFKDSPCNDWITADNYKVAKEHGFIPSYPPLADKQGPDPEAWEYVWVGTEGLYE